MQPFQDQLSQSGTYPSQDAAQRARPAQADRRPLVLDLDGTLLRTDLLVEHIVAALDRLFDRREGQALIRLMADGVAGAIKPLAQATQDWCDDIGAAIVVMLRADDPDEDPEVADAAASFLAPAFEHLAEELFTSALGRGLVRLPKIAFYLFPDDREEA